MCPSCKGTYQASCFVYPQHNDNRPALIMSRPSGRRDGYFFIVAQFIYNTNSVLFQWFTISRPRLRAPHPFQMQFGILQQALPRPQPNHRQPPEARLLATAVPYFLKQATLSITQVRSRLIDSKHYCAAPSPSISAKLRATLVSGKKLPALAATCSAGTAHVL